MLVSWVSGGFLLLAGALASPAAVERLFLGAATGSLAWGPHLFRALLLFHGASLVAFGIILSRRPAAAHSVPDVPSVTPVGAWVAVASLCAVALALRLFHLGTDLWLDEVLTLTDFLRRPLLEIVTMFPSQNQHPLYSLLARVSIVVFGESFAAVRLPAVLFGAASIWALFLLGRRIVGVRETLLACALMTVSYHHVWFSQNARGYIGLLFFSLLATWLWIAAIDRGTARQWIAYAIAASLGIWLHMTMVFVLAAHGLVYLGMLARSLSPRPHAGALQPDPAFRWKAPVAWFFAGTLSLQLHALALPEFLRSALHEVSLESEWINPMWVLEESVRRLADGGLGGLVVVAALAILAVGLVSLAARDWRLPILLIAPAMLGGGTMLALGHNLWPRFFFFCMGFFLLLAVRGTMAASQWIFARVRLPGADRWAVRAATAGWVLVIIASATTVPRAYLPKQDFSGARAWLEQAREPGDRIVAVGLAGDAYRRYYAPDWIFVAAQDDLEAIDREGRRVWLVYTLPVHVEAWLPDIWAVIQRDYEIVRVFPGTLGGGDVVVCRRVGRAG